MKKRRTLKEQYDEILVALQSEGKRYAHSVLPNLATSIYQHEGKHIVEWEVKEVKFQIPFYNKEKPSRKDLAAIKEYAERPKFDPRGVRIVLYREAHYGKMTTSIEGSILYPYSEDKQSLIPALNRWIEQFGEKPGHKACAYCRKQTPVEDMVERTIISFATYGRNGKKNLYCSSECGLNDQMAHEG